MTTVVISRADRSIKMHLYIYSHRSRGLYTRRRVGPAVAQSLNRVTTTVAAREFSSTPPPCPRLFSPGEIVMSHARAWVCVCVYEKRPGLWAVRARVYYDEVERWATGWCRLCRGAGGGSKSLRTVVGHGRPLYVAPLYV